MLDAGRSHLFDAPHLTIFPGLAIALARPRLQLPRRRPARSRRSEAGAVAGRLGSSGMLARFAAHCRLLQQPAAIAPRRARCVGSFSSSPSSIARAGFDLSGAPASVRVASPRSRPSVAEHAAPPVRGRLTAAADVRHLQRQIADADADAGAAGARRDRRRPARGSRAAPGGRRRSDRGAPRRRRDSRRRADRPAASPSPAAASARRARVVRKQQRAAEQRVSASLLSSVDAPARALRSPCSTRRDRLAPARLEPDAAERDVGVGVVRDAARRRGRSVMTARSGWPARA